MGYELRWRTLFVTYFKITYRLLVIGYGREITIVGLFRNP
jgi:hypothetical protein